MRLTAVSYLNTKPFIYGIYRSALADHVELSLDIPSECARKLRDGEADLALAPVAIIPELAEAHLISNYCIGAVGPVRTVSVFSEVPLEQIETLYLDFHSRTSVALTRLLCAQYWRIQPELVPASAGFEAKIGGTTAGLIIGDRAFGLNKRYPYAYDLSEAWNNWTGLPFVFAAWISVRPLGQEFVTQFNQALQAGLDHLPELIKILPQMPADIDLETYYKHNISYVLDEAKWQGLHRFLTSISGENGYVLKR
jgi:chorismate dehydratase